MRYGNIVAIVRRPRIAIFVLVTSLVAFGLAPGAQSSTARTIVRTAIDRMGGEALLRSIKTIRFERVGYRNMLEQSERPEGPWIPEVERAVEAWDIAGRQWSSTADLEAGEFHFKQQQIVSAGAAATSFDGRWSPGSRSLIQEMDERFAWSPFLVMLSALDASDLEQEADRVFQSVPHHVVSWTSKEGRTRALLNSQTGYLTAIETTRAYPDDLYWQVWGDVTNRVSYSYWSIEANGWRLPRQWDVERNGQPASVITIASIALNPELAANTFAIPEDARSGYQARAKQTLDDPAFGSPARPVRELAPGVVEIPSSWDITLVRQDDGVVVIEAPISAGYSKKALEEAERRFPGVKVKAVISTSDSWPHFGGIREYVARGIEAYVLDLNEPILLRAVTSPRRLHPDALAAHPRAPRFRRVSAKTVVGSGPNRLELYPVRGETGERMMAVYMPQHRILYGSDLVQWGRGGPPEYVSELVDLAAREKLAVDTVYAMHADPSPWSRVLSAVAGQSAAGVVLEPAKTIERELEPRQEHLYELAVAQNECVTVVVEQRGIDVTVQTRRPDNSVIADIQLDVTLQGQERVDLVADAAGTYAIAVKSGPGIKSGAYTIRVAGRKPAMDADRAMQEVWALRTKASGLRSAAKHAEAKPLLERALATAERIRGANDVLVGILLTDLANAASAQRDDATAEPLLQRSIGILEKAWGTEHPYPAYVRSRLSLVEQHEGHAQQAEALLRDAIQVLERTVGAEHPWTVACLSNQGILRNLAGDTDRAIEIYVRVLAIHEKLGDTSTANYAGALNNLGDLYRQKQDYAGAEELMLRSLAITEKLEGAETFHASILYQSLGIVAREQKDYARAMSYYSRALAIRERLLGPDHPDVAPILNNIGGVQAIRGDEAGAIETFSRAVRITEQIAGPGHATAVLAVGNIARAYASQGNIAAALEFQRRADEVIEKQIRLNLSVGSERERLAFMNSIAVRTDRTISLSLHEAAGDSAAARQAALVLLQRKGRVLDAMTDTFAAVRKRVVDPQERAALDELRTTSAQLARLALSASTSAADIQSPVEKLKALQERLETALSVYSSELCAELHTVTLEAVQAAIPERTALIEFAVFRPFDPKAWSETDAYGPPRYAAFVLHRTGAPQGFDLGAVSEIDPMVAVLRESLRDPARTDVKVQARALDRRVLQPLRAAVGDAGRLLISPDGQLNLVPFETFVDEEGRYLVETHATSYLTSGRDLLRLPATPASESTAVVVVADPLFGEPGLQTAGGERPAAKLLAAHSARRSVTIGDDLSSMYFAPLIGTAAEARIIRALFPKATVLTGRNATKAAIERLAAPRILHIASHGFFVQRKIDNPLLRSGLALAGANATHDPDAAGILTALEASSLNLWGTRLVTLSACDTGVGEVRNGEGVYGLRRAFVLAGTETVVMSLWPVSDYISREVMQGYYTGLRGGLGRGDALREARLALMKRKNREHPFYWASFIQSGEWANLDGKR
jgi:CHAT domain-containing protein/Tfp pilus assembly protein PilF